MVLGMGYARRNRGAGERDKREGNEDEAIRLRGPGFLLADCGRLERGM